ncbi:MAG: hypothetical protein R2811_13220 [Flavobacteriales bacterium]
MSTDKHTVETLTTSISGKLRNTNLAKRKALWPLFEVISNSIHAIEERFGASAIEKGKIEVRIQRPGESTLLENKGIDQEEYPVVGFTVQDNGVGLDNDNYQSFKTSDSEKKSEKGAKGLGRFVCLKAFKTVEFKSAYRDGQANYIRQFNFKAQNPGIFEYSVTPTESKVTGTSVSLTEFRDGYQKYCPRRLDEIGHKIIDHFLIHFLTDQVPEIRLVDVNLLERNLLAQYREKLKPTIQSRDFTVGDEAFTIHLIKSDLHRNETHHIYYCGNGRSVIDEKLNDHIPDLGSSIEEDGSKYVYKAYVTGTYLDDHVGTERTKFEFPEVAEQDELDIGEVTLSMIRDEAVRTIEVMLSSYLDKVIARKFEEYSNHIGSSAPQFSFLLKYLPEKVQRIKPGMVGSKLDIELYKLQQEFAIEVKEEGEEFLELANDITEGEEYLTLVARYEEFIEKLNDATKSQLASYVVHRKAVIDLLDKFLGLQENGSFMTEETIHNIFFPIRKESDEVSFDKQNLWLLDERLTYHHYLASEKKMSQVAVIENGSDERPDLLISKHRFAFVEQENEPYSTFVIVEFKRPDRNDYSWSEGKNPIDQISDYVDEIRNGKIRDRLGRVVNFRSGTYFYAFLVCDRAASLDRILRKRGFSPMPDGERYTWFNPELQTMYEVVTYQQLLTDARRRNRMFFEKLGIHKYPVG